MALLSFSVYFLMHFLMFFIPSFRISNNTLKTNKVHSVSWLILLYNSEFIEAVESIFVLFQLLLLQFIKGGCDFLFRLDILTCQILHILCCRFKRVEVFNAVSEIENVPLREIVTFLIVGHVVDIPRLLGTIDDVNVGKLRLDKFPPFTQFTPSTRDGNAKCGSRKLVAVNLSPAIDLIPVSFQKRDQTAAPKLAKSIFN